MGSKAVFLILLFATGGLALGLGSFTFIYGKGYSYFGDDPKSCANCHIMHETYDSWSKSSHKSVTTCYSCHAPENIYLKYFNKAENGFNHSWKFTTGWYKEPIKIRKHNFNIVMNSCLKCHGELMSAHSHQEQLLEGRSCVQCHKNIGHDH